MRPRRELDPIFERPGRFFVDNEALCLCPRDLMRVLSEVLIFRACESVFCNGTEYYGYSMLFAALEQGSEIPCYRFRCGENREIVVDREGAGVAPRYMPPPSLARPPESKLDGVPEHHGRRTVDVGWDPE